MDNAIRFLGDINLGHFYLYLIVEFQYFIRICNKFSCYFTYMNEAVLFYPNIYECTKPCNIRNYSRHDHSNFYVLNFINTCKFKWFQFCSGIQSGFSQFV